MKREEQVNEVYIQILSKLETELNSEISKIINVDEIRNKISNYINGDDDDKNIFNNIYPLIYSSALQNLTKDVFFEDSNCINIEDDEKPSTTLKDDGLPPDRSHPALKSFQGNNVDSCHINNTHASKLNDLDSTKFANIFCSLLPHLEKHVVESKLKENFHIPGYKAILLKKYIRSAVDSGCDISDKVFSTLEEWLDETSQYKNGEKALQVKSNVCTVTKPQTEYSETTNNVITLFDDDQMPKEPILENQGENNSTVCMFDAAEFWEKVKFISETVPNVPENKVWQEILQCLNRKEADAVILSYMKYFDSPSQYKVEVTNKKNFDLGAGTSTDTTTLSLPSIISPENDLGCIIVSEKKYKAPVLISFEEDASSSASNNSDILVVGESLPQPQDVADNLNKPNQIKVNSLSSTNKPMKNGQPDAASPYTIDNILKGSSYSQEQEVAVISVEKTYQGQSNFESKPQVIPIQNGLNKGSDNTNETTLYLREDNIEMDSIPWEEAQMIGALVSFVQLKNIHQSIIDNYYDPQRKIKVLREYIELAFDEGYEIRPEAFETLSQWQSEKKRAASEVEGAYNRDYKKQKSHLPDHAMSPLASTSKEIPLLAESHHNIYQDEPNLSNIPSFNDKKEESQEMQPLSIIVNTGSIKDSNIDNVFNSFPEETKNWYQKKIVFLKEATNGLSEHYILSQIIHCQNEEDILHVAARLFEEQTANILNLNASQANENNERKIEETLLQNVPEKAPDQVNNDNVATASTNIESNSNLLSAADIEDRIQAHIQQLQEIFPDADPDFLCEKANEIAGDNNKFAETVVDMTEKKSYPKMEEYLKHQKKLEMRRKFIEGMSIDEFMEYFEDPEKMFCDTTTEMSQLYKKNVKTQLMKDLPFHLSKIIDFVLHSNNYHYLPTLRKLEDMKGTRKSKRSSAAPQPADMDDVFLKELCYARMQATIKKHNETKEREKQLAFEKAKEEGTLMECQCCYDDEVLLQDASACYSPKDPHFFCNNCIKRYSEEQIGQGRLEFWCLDGECKVPFSLSTLKKILRPSVFSNLLKRKQAEEIAAAGIEDLESCPFCNFATIMPNKEDKVFKCLNSECLKDSCRLCREMNHVPLRCEEVEKRKQTNARTFLENEMTEAMIRECYKCKRRFIKEEGCNKMVCSCGAMMCYLCKMPITGYDHFNKNSSMKKDDSSKCPLWTNSLQLHAEEVRLKAQEAKEKLEPGIDLVHDPTNDLPEIPDYLKKSRSPVQPALNNVDNRRREIPHHPWNHAGGAPTWITDIMLVEALQRHSQNHPIHYPFALQPPNVRRAPPPPHLPPPPAHSLRPLPLPPDIPCYDHPLAPTPLYFGPPPHLPPPRPRPTKPLNPFPPALATDLRVPPLSAFTVRPNATERFGTLPPRFNPHTHGLCQQQQHNQPQDLQERPLLPLSQHHCPPQEPQLRPLQPPTTKEQQPSNISDQYHF